MTHLNGRMVKNVMSAQKQTNHQCGGTQNGHGAQSEIQHTMGRKEWKSVSALGFTAVPALPVGALSVPQPRLLLVKNSFTLAVDSVVYQLSKAKQSVKLGHITMKFSKMVLPIWSGSILASITMNVPLVGVFLSGKSPSFRRKRWVSLRL